MYRDLVIIRQIPVLREDMGTGRDYIAAGYDSTLHSRLYHAAALKSMQTT